MKSNNLYRHKWTKKRMIWCIIISCRAQNFVRNKRYVWIEFIVTETENWKYCNKIIFKCVNSIMRLIFNIFKCMNSAATVVNNDFCLLHSKFMWFYCSCAEKKKKLKLKCAKRTIQMGTKFGFGSGCCCCVCVYLFFFLRTRIGGQMATVYEQ